MSAPRFARTVIGELVNDSGPGAMNTFLLVADLDNDGYQDVVLSGRNGKMAWFKNPGREGGAWQAYHMAEVSDMECGGVAFDLDGDGYKDVILGGDYRSDELRWWHNPGRPGAPWACHVIARTGHRQMHDAIIGEVTGDGRPSLVFWNQHSGETDGATLYRLPLPDDPTISPWPGLEVIAREKREDGQPEEGLAIGDVDGDGQDELVAGTWWYKYRAGRWEEYKFAVPESGPGYLTTRLAIGDVNGDGRNEIVVSEGDPCIYGRPWGGRLAWFEPGEDVHGPWREHRLAEGLLDAHTCRLGDVCGNGHLDIFTAEIGTAGSYRERPPRLLVFENDGRGSFTRHVIDEGEGVHEAVLVDLRRRGVLDIVGRPLQGPNKWKLYAWYNEG